MGTGVRIICVKMGIRDAHFRGCLFSLDTGAFVFVRSREVVRFWEGPLGEVPLYTGMARRPRISNAKCLKSSVEWRFVLRFPLSEFRFPIPFSDFCFRTPITELRATIRKGHDGP